MEGGVLWQRLGRGEGKGGKQTHEEPGNQHGKMLTQNRVAGHD